LSAEQTLAARLAAEKRLQLGAKLSGCGGHEAQPLAHRLAPDLQRVSDRVQIDRCTAVGGRVDPRLDETQEILATARSRSSDFADNAKTGSGSDSAGGAERVEGRYSSITT